MGNGRRRPATAVLSPGGGWGRRLSDGSQGELLIVGRSNSSLSRGCSRKSSRSSSMSFLSANEGPRSPNTRLLNWKTHPGATAPSSLQTSPTPKSTSRSCIRPLCSVETLQPYERSRSTKRIVAALPSFSLSWCITGSFRSVSIVLPSFLYRLNFAGIRILLLVLAKPADQTHSFKTPCGQLQSNSRWLRRSRPHRSTGHES